jgi:hypothetical protein
MRRPGAEWLILRRAEMRHPTAQKRGSPHVPDDGVPLPQSQPVTLAEALERLLPGCNDNPFDAANWLNDRQETGKIRLLGVPVPKEPGAAPGLPVMMAPNANPVMLRIMARVPTDGRNELYVSGLGVAYQDWTFERESFEAQLPDAAATVVDSEPVDNAPVDRRGRPEEFSVVDLITEALVYAAVVGRLPQTIDGVGGLHEQLEYRLGPRCPRRTRFYEVFSPIFRRAEEERQREPRIR